MNSSAIKLSYPWGVEKAQQSLEVAGVVRSEGKSASIKSSFQCILSSNASPFSRCFVLCFEHSSYISTKELRRQLSIRNNERKGESNEPQAPLPLEREPAVGEDYMVIGRKIEQSDQQRCRWRLPAGLLQHQGGGSGDETSHHSPGKPHLANAATSAEAVCPCDQLDGRLPQPQDEHQASLEAHHGKTEYANEMHLDRTPESQLVMTRELQDASTSHQRIERQRIPKAYTERASIHLQAATKRDALNRLLRNTHRNPRTARQETTQTQKSRP